MIGRRQHATSNVASTDADTRALRPNEMRPNRQPWQHKTDRSSSSTPSKDSVPIVHTVDARPPRLVRHQSQSEAENNRNPDSSRDQAGVNQFSKLPQMP